MFPHPLAVEVVNSLGDGVEHSTGLSLREKLLPEDLVQQLPALHQLRHQVHVPALIIHLTHEHTRRHRETTRQCGDCKKVTVMGPTQNVTHVFQSDDVGMLPVSHQDFDLFRGIPLDFVYNLRHMETQTVMV